MDELTIEGKLYISSKRAAKVSGYAKDYIGQLCREGRVDSKLVGRSWYVYEPSIREHRFNDERSKAKKKGLNEDAVESPILESADETPLEKVWESPSYTSEPFEPIPAIEEPTTAAETASDAPKNLSEMQSAWQEWFATRKDTRVEEKPEAVSEEQHEPAPSPVEAYSAVQTPEAVPVRMIVSDIAPKRERNEAAEPIAVRHYESSRKEEAGQKRRRKASISPLVVKSLLGALIVFSVSVMLVATGIIENLHVGSIAETPILQFFQGSTVVNK